MGNIKLGARWPDYAPEIAIDRGTIRAFIEAVDELGFDHVTAFDHPISMNAETAGSEIPWTPKRTWHESLTLMSHMSALTDSLGFMTAIYVLPLRSAIFVAKQAASLDNFTNGRFRLGVALGYEREYRILHSQFDHRGARLEEQIAVLRALWTNELTSFHGEWHDFPDIGLSSKLVNKSIPIWLGMNRDPQRFTLRRAGRLADGVLPVWPPDEVARGHLEKIFDAARDVGRDPGEIGIEPAINLRSGRSSNLVVTQKKTDNELADEVKAWSELGATHLEFKSRSCGLSHLDEHLVEMARFKEIADSVLS